MMYYFIRKYIRRILSGLGVLFLGALSTPLWTDIIHPLFTTCIKIILNISTLGLIQFKNIIYLDIAKGLHEETSLQMFNFVLGITFSILISTLFILIRLLKNINAIKSNKKILHSNRFFLFTKKMIEHNFFQYFLVAYMLFVIGFITVIAVQQEYINNAITYYNQLLIIDKPFINDEQIKIYDSEFAQIKNRENYVHITSNLIIIAKQHKQSVPVVSFIF